MPCWAVTRYHVEFRRKMGGPRVQKKTKCAYSVSTIPNLFHNFALILVITNEIDEIGFYEKSIGY